MAEMNGSRVLVTGGSSGIGLETARQLRAAGAEICIVARRQQPIDDAVAELGGDTWGHPCDVADAEQVAALETAVRARWDGLDGLVNNAGVATMGSVDDLEIDDWDHSFSVNVRGPFLMCKAFGELLKAGNTPAVVNVSTTLAEKAIPGMAAYNASKAALNQMTRSLALEWAPKVRVTAVMPAVVDTPIHAGRGLTPDNVRMMARMHPLRRIGMPADVASMIVYLLSDKATWMTGAVIPVDGGMMAT